MQNGMADRQTNIKFLTGSPDVSRLNWSEENLTAKLCLRARKFVGEDVEEAGQSQTTTSFSFPAWRWVDFKGDMSHQIVPASPNRMSPAFIHALTDVDINKIDFLEHSLAAIQELKSSQIQALDETFASVHTSFTNTTILSTTDTSFATSDGSFPQLSQSLAFSGPITDLNRVPSAQQLRRLHPQTVTLNLVVGLITRSATRTVSLRRRRDVEMDIIELLVGDETRAGFGISFWLPASKDSHIDMNKAIDSSHESKQQREALESLRPGDVMLLTNVALGEYKGGVFGQSLNRRTTRNRTSVMLLRRPEELSGWLLVKTNKVSGWAEGFVGTAKGKKRASGDVSEPRDRGSKKRYREQAEILPPDTQ